MSYIDDRKRVLNEQIRLAKMNNDVPQLRACENRLDELERFQKDNSFSLTPAEKENKSEDISNGYSKAELKEKTVKELKEMCSELGVEGYSSMKKAELIDVLRNE